LYDLLLRRGGFFIFFSLLTRIWRNELKNQENIDCKKNSIKELLNGNKDSESGSGSSLGIKVLVFRWLLGEFLRWGIIIENKYKIYNTF
jgi:hypothetical protein